MKNAAIYPGTFDPVTNGHLDIISRGAEIFGRIIVAVAEGGKKAPMFSLDERVQMLSESLGGYRGVTVEPFRGLLANFARERESRVVIRGLRAVSDFEYEFQLALMNRKLSPDLDTMFVMPSEKYVYLNSSLVREIAALGGDVADLVPPAVARRLRERFK